MRNSLLPLLLLASTVGLAVWLIRPHDGEERGAGGPEIFPGIVKIPKRQSRMTASAMLDGTTTHQGTAPADSAHWRVIVVAGTDDSKLTKAVVFALGEEITKRGCIAILDPKLRNPQEPVPLGSDGCLRVTAVDQPLGKRPGAIDARWSIEAIPTRLPADCAAARWLPELPASAPTTLTLTHRSTPLDAPAWPAWFAAIGRAVATETLNALNLPTDNVDAETTHAIRQASWMSPGEVDAHGMPMNHFERIPSPPQTDILTRTVAFQYPLVRGWIGYLSPLPIKKHSGTITTSRDELIRRLKTKWQPGPTVLGSEIISYSIDDRQADGITIHRTITINGSHVIEWQERPQPVAVLENWKKAAASGNADAIELLRLHQHTVGLP